MRTNLNEEIQKNLKLMGILNEAASPSKAIFNMLFKSLDNAGITRAINKINANIKGPNKITGIGISGLETAIKNNLITRKQATKIIVDALKESGQSIDDIAASVATISPNFMKAVQDASKRGVDKADVKAAVPELQDLSDELVDAILKKGGYEGIGKTMDDINKLIIDYTAQFPELFSKKGLFKNGEYKNSAMIAQVQQKIFKRFAGKNKTAVADEIEKIIQEANEAIKNSTLPDAEKKKWFTWISENTPQTIKDVLKAPVVKDQLGNVKAGATQLNYMKNLIILGLIPGVIVLGWAGTKAVYKSADKVNDFVDKNFAEGSLEGFTEFIKKEYPEYPIDGFTLDQNSDTEFSALYTDKQSGKQFGPFKFTFEKGAYIYK